MRKIGIDGNSLTRSLTGVGTYLYDVLRYLLEIDQESEYYVFSHDELCVEFDNSKNITLINSHSINVVTWYLYDLPKEMRKHDLEIFWEPGNRLPCLPPNEIKLVTTLHDMACYLFPQYCSWQTALMEKLYLRRTCDRSEKIISISEATKKDIINTFSIDEQKIETIYNGDSPFSKNDVFDENKWKSIQNKFGVTNLFFLFVGSISPRKNVMTIVKAYDEYRKQGGDGQLVLAGKMAWKSDKIKKTIEDSSYNKDIIVTGYIDEEEKEYFYKYSECLLFPSLYEGFGFPILEAMSVGTRVITSNISSMPEVALDAALFLNVLDDQIELANLMMQMRNMSVEKRRGMIERGYLRVEAFNRKDTAIKTMELFKKL